MKAIRVHQFGGPEVLELEDVPDPTAGPGQVIVRVQSAGVNPFEGYQRAGKYGSMSFPYTPGVDAGGIVDSTGEGVTAFKPGDRVYVYGSLTGTYAQLSLCEQSQVHHLPGHLTAPQGAALGVPYGTAYYALFLRAKALPGETILIHGASGGVGTAATQLARAAGLTVFGTASTEEGRNLIKGLGAHYALDHSAPDYLDQMKAYNNGEGVNLIIEMLANQNLGKDLGVLAPKGRVVAVGSRGPVEIDPRLTMGGDLTILGMSLNNANEQELKQIHAALYAGLASRTLNPIIGKEIPLAEAGRAHQEIMESGAHGKIVLVP